MSHTQQSRPSVPQRTLRKIDYFNQLLERVHDSDASKSHQESTSAGNGGKRVCFIPDPNLRSDVVHMQDNVFFTDALITADELTIIFPAGGHFSVIADNLEGDTNLKRVRIDKWLLLMVDVRRMYSEYFNIRVVRWETFFSWLMGGDITHPETGPCRGADLVLGGIDYTTEYINTVNGITRENYQRFDERMDIFASHMRIWPPIAPSREGAIKNHRIQMLDYISTYITRTPRPESMLWDGQHVPHGKVLKRTHSAFGNHVFLPTAPPPSVQQLQGLCDLPGRQWIVQDWVPTLRQLGEYKVYFVEGEIVWVSVARFNENTSGWYAMDTNNETRRLHEVAAMLRAGPILHDYLFPPEPPQGISHLSDLIMFSKRTFEGLTSRERGYYGDSLLLQWCRMDVGIMTSGDACWYFVNEVETNMGLGLFGEGCHRAVMNGLAGLWHTLLYSPA
ncbi:hypothetical protein QCA50_006320 [Cerrena zonata]|uniref:Uncharacterized protein n=1 Tax=Cerrena zonata TaxID=2478898 RepID=A0AAW0FGZ1_9APHY